MRLLERPRLPYVEIQSIQNADPEMREQAARSLYGTRNGDCSVANMNTTCFAAEHCAACDGAGARFPTADTFDAAATDTLVAVRRSPSSETAYGDARRSRADTFAGCACVGPRHVYPDWMYPSEANVEADANVIFNLCVSNGVRQGGVGRQLVTAARQRAAGRPLYLFVSKAGLRSPNEDVASVMRARVDRLEETYKRMGLTRCGHTDTTVLFKVA